MMMAPYSGLGMWVWEASRNDPNSFCARLRSNNYDWVVVKAHDGGSAFNSGAQIDAWHAACRKHGLKFGIWGYVYRGSDAHMALQACGRFHPDFYVADAEIEMEQASGPESQAFCQIFRGRLKSFPACISSFGRIDFHAGLDWHSWHNFGFDVMPQAYECESSALAPALCVNAAQIIWARNRIFPTLGSYTGARGTLSGQELHDSVAHIALPGVNLWDSQELHGDQLEKLGTLASHPRPPVVHPVPHKPPPVVQKPASGHLFPEVVHRALRLTSPHTRGKDVQYLQQALNIWAHDHGGPTVTVDGEFGPDTRHVTAVVAFAEGLLDTSASKDTILKIWHPWRRNPVEIRRGKQRRDAAAKAGGGQKGLAALPVIAAHYIGIEERPADSNWGLPHPADWEEACGFTYGPWCAAFASAVIRLGGGHVALGYCPTIEADAQAKTGGFDLWVPNHTQGVGPGWLVLYDWNGDGVADHVGVVESIQADHLVAIEGNTGGTDPAAGGMVARESRGYGPTLGYARPRI